jgi:tetratricopeptide (TPR) repeat protein
LLVIVGVMMDLGNPVLKLCQDGMRAEAEGRLPEARALFEQAWAARADDYDACVAAHYLARRQEDPAEILHWNREALRHAGAVGDDRVAALYPSLLVSVAMAHERLGDIAAAREAFERAAEHDAALPAGEYGEQLRAAVADGLRRSS